MASSSKVCARVVRIASHEGAQPIDFPLQRDGTISFESLSHQFSDHGSFKGLYYKASKESQKTIVFLDMKTMSFFAPDFEGDWKDTIYICEFFSPTPSTSTCNSNTIVFMVAKCCNCMNIVYRFFSNYFTSSNC